MSTPVAGSTPPATGATSMTGRLGVWILGFLFVVLSGALGALLGGLWVRFLMPPAADGWTGIAQGLGGLMVGGLLGLLVGLLGVVPVARGGTRRLGFGVAGVALAAALVFLVLFLSRPNRPAAPGSTSEPSRTVTPDGRLNSSHGVSVPAAARLAISPHGDPR